MCTGRIDLAFVLRAFQKGADGVIVGGCWPGECHYVTEGNYDALGNMHLCKRLLTHIGVDPGRLRIEWIAASEGSRFAEVMSDFARHLKARGPLRPTGGSERKALTLKLDAIDRLVPYLKLVEREKLRIATRTEAAYDAFYQSEAMDHLFAELIADKLTISQILLLLGQGPLSTAEISAALGLSSSEVAKHITRSSSQGLVRYDRQRGSYTLA